MFLIPSSYAIEPMWLTAACFDMKFAAWDKFGTKDYEVLYKVKSEKGSEYIAKFNASGHNSSHVEFPRDFKESSSGKKASVECHGTNKYLWEIHVQGELKDSGTIVFSRGK